MLYSGPLFRAHVVGEPRKVCCYSCQFGITICNSTQSSEGIWAIYGEGRPDEGSARPTR